MQYSYTPEGWLESITKADGTILSFEYDKTGSLLTQNVGDWQNITSSYNEIGMVTEVSSTEGTIVYQCDERGYLISVANVNGDVVSYTYDEYGNKTSMTYPDGRVVSYTYDSMNRMTSVTGLDGDVTRYTYDAAGRRVETSSSSLTTAYSYDSVGNLLEQATSGASEIAFSYSYNKNGYITGEVRRENGKTTTSTYAYDALGQLTSFLQSTGYGEQYAYDKAGNMTEKVMTPTHGADAEVQTVTLKMSYNKANQLTAMANGKDKITYKYDKNGSMVQKALSSKTYGKLTDSYTYNALDQLTSYAGYDGYQQQFTYDANGMRLSKSEAGDANRSTLEELLRGNIAGLPEIVEPTQNQTNSDEADIPAELEWATTEYLYDLTQEYYQVIQETTASANGASATTAYAYGLERIAAYTANSKTSYVYDGRGSVAQAVTVPVAGEAVASALPDVSVQVKSFSYTAFGEQMGTRKVSGYAYNAEAYDAATGMLNLRARLYEPAMNRFSQKDIYPSNPIVSASFNHYLFTYNSPVSFMDADGLSAKSIGSVLSSIGSKLQKVASGIGKAAKNIASAVFGKKIVNTVVSGAKSVAKTIRTAVQPIVDTVSTAWSKATQMYREAQAEISKLDKTDPYYHLQVDAIYRSACAKYMGNQEEKNDPAAPEQQIYTVEKGMVLQTSQNALGRAVLPAGNYTQQEIVNFIVQYGDPALIHTTLNLVSQGSMTYQFPDGSIRTVTTTQELQNVIDAHREQSVIQRWEPSISDEISMLLKKYKGHPEKVIQLVYQYTLQPHADRYIRFVRSENLLEAASNLENFLTIGMVDDTKLMFFGDSLGSQIGAGTNLLLKAFTLGGDWSVVLKDGSIVTSQDLIQWGERYGGLPRGSVPAGTFNSAFGKYQYNMIENPGPLARIDQAAASTFESGKYNVVTLQEDTVLYRAGDSTGDPLGRYFIQTPPNSVAQVRIDLAIKEQWIDPSTGALTGTSTIDSYYTIKIPKGTTVYIGPSSYQEGIYLGGGEQVFIEKPWLIEGVEVISNTPLN